MSNFMPVCVPKIRPMRFAVTAALLLGFAGVCGAQPRPILPDLPEMNFVGPIPPWQLPPGPSNPIATYSAETQQVTLQWTLGSVSKTALQVCRLRLINGELGDLQVSLLPANATTFTDSPTESGHYVYQVAWINGIQMSQRSPEAPIDVVLPIPAGPQSVSASDLANRRAVVNWTDVALNENGYEVERTPPLSGGNWITGPSITAFIDNCGPGTFSYRVRSFNGNGASDWSDPVTVTVAENPPAVPINLRVADAGNDEGATVTWTDVSDNESWFVIERKPAAAADADPAVQFQVGANVSTTSDSPGAGNFKYRIASGNAAGQSEWMEWVTVYLGGWTVFTPSADTRIVYVSSSDGNDSNDGLAPERPKRTIAAGYEQLRNGYPDWILLKRGDTWDETFGVWRKSGRSSVERMRIGSYGAGTERPLLRTGESNAFTRQGGGGSPIVGFIALDGISFVPHLRTAATDVIGFSWGEDGQDILIEDCKFSSYGANIVVQSSAPRVTGVTIRRCILVDAYSSGGHAQGIYASKVDGLLIEECVLDHNGWNESAPGAEPTIFNHNIYIQSDCGPVTVRDCIIAQGASHGLQLRAGGLMHGNLFIRNALAAFVDSPNGGASEVSNNVVLSGRDLDAQNPRGTGLDVINNAGIGTVVVNNLIAHREATGGNGTAIAVWTQGVRVEDNCVYNWSSPGESAIAFTNNSMANWSGMTFLRNRVILPTNGGAIVNVTASPYVPGRFTVGGNSYYTSIMASRWFLTSAGYASLAGWTALTSDTGSVTGLPVLPDATRDIAKYNESIGGAASIADFLSRARGQSHANWDRRLTAREANSWIVAGFGMD